MSETKLLYDSYYSSETKNLFINNIKNNNITNIIKYNYELKELFNDSLKKKYLKDIFFEIRNRFLRNLFLHYH